MIRILRLPLAVLALTIFALSSTAHAQIGAYGMFTVDRLSGIQSSPLAIAATPTGSTAAASFNDSVNPTGFTGGAFYDFKTFGPARLGVDLRGSITNTKRGADLCCEGAGTHIYSGLGGIRASFHTLKPYIKPYVQVSAGIARSNFGLLTNASTSQYVLPGVQLTSNLEYHGYAGVDLAFAPFADWRVVELGYGGLRSFGSAAHTYPILSISTGVVFHFSSLP